MAMDRENKTVEEDKEILFRIVTLNNEFQVYIYCQYIHLAWFIHWLWSFALYFNLILIDFDKRFTILQSKFGQNLFYKHHSPIARLLFFLDGMMFCFGFCLQCYNITWKYLPQWKMCAPPTQSPVSSSPLHRVPQWGGTNIKRAWYKIRPLAKNGCSHTRL